MADKKTTKKVAEKKDITTMSNDELVKLLSDTQADYMTAQRSHNSRELINPRVLTTTRKEIARIRTAIRANELKESK